MREYGHLPRWRSLTALGLTVALLLLATPFVLKPVKLKLAERYESRGDTYFSRLQFKDAEGEYRQALQYDPQRVGSVNSLRMAQLSESDLKAGLPFFKAHNITEVVNLLNDATMPYPTPKESLEEGVKLFSVGRFAYARYPLERAVLLDPEYPEAWNYLGLTYQELAKEEPGMKGKAEEAFNKRDSLTVIYIKSL